jgi:tRNA threonylcarbamoyladenosine modification (KEOPS) complex  Pcc1 subunit
MALIAVASCTPPAPPILSNNADLYALTISSGTLAPVFASGTITYTCSVVNTTASVTVTTTKADAGASIQVRVNNGAYAAVTSGSASGSLSLNTGANTIDVRVTAADTTTIKIYTITVTRAVGISNNADLSALTISDGTLSPAFAGGTITYTDSVVYTVTSVTVTPTKADSGATITVNGAPVASGTASASIGLSVGSGNIITVLVTAQDTSTTKTYTITVTRTAASANANLSGLTISSGAFDQAFDPMRLTYTQNVLGSVTGATVTPTAAGIGATITVNGTLVASGGASGTINFVDGPNTITVIVTAQDTSTTKTITIFVVRRANGTITFNLSGADAQDGKTVWSADFGFLGVGSAVIASGSASIPLGYTYTGGNIYSVWAFIDVDGDAATTGYQPDLGDYYLTTNVDVFVDGSNTVNAVYPGEFTQF